MIKYCKAYPINRFRAFEKWTEKVPVAEPTQPENADGSTEPTEPFLYLHDTYIVTDGIFSNEKVVFDEVMPEWIEFCKNELKFEPPAYELPAAAAQQQASSSAAG